MDTAHCKLIQTSPLFCPFTLFLDFPLHFQLMSHLKFLSNSKTSLDTTVVITYIIDLHNDIHSNAETDTKLNSTCYKIN